MHAEGRQNTAFDKLSDRNSIATLKCELEQDVARVSIDALLAGFFAGARRPDVVATPTYDFGKWNDGGPDRFVQNNRPAVIDINAFAWPGGCGTAIRSLGGMGEACNAGDASSTEVVVVDAGASTSPPQNKNPSPAAAARVASATKK